MKWGQPGYRRGTPGQLKPTDPTEVCPICKGALKDMRGVGFRPSQAWEAGLCVRWSDLGFICNSTGYLGGQAMRVTRDWDRFVDWEMSLVPARTRCKHGWGDCSVCGTSEARDVIHRARTPRRRRPHE